MEVKIKKLVDTAVIPAYASAGDAGMDLVATSVNVVDEGNNGYIEYGTGLAVEIPEGYFGMLVSRSSVSKTGLIHANPPGIIDSGYRGEIKIRFKYIYGTPKYEIGERCCQLIILPYPKINFKEVEDLEDTNRGSGGFGSTGN